MQCSATQSKKRVFIATVGTFLEWAEFTYYAYIADLIARLFFPQLTPSLAFVATFSIFALSYLFRPLGSIFFGYLGDKRGRRVALQSSIMLMGVSSILIGCLPAYDRIGWLAPVLLLIFRSIQGFAVSGEFNGSAIYLIEHDSKRPCLAGSWTAFASASGMMFGSLMSVLIYLPGLPEWAWRLPFLLGALSCFCAMYFRKHLSETPAYLTLNAQSIPNPLKALYATHKAALVRAIMLVAALAIYLYTMSLYYSTHLIKYTTLTAPQTKLIVTAGQCLVAVFILIVAQLADRMDEKKLIHYGLMSFFVAAPVVYLVPYTNSFGLILFGQVFYALGNALVGTPVFKLLNEFFPTTMRYSGVSIAWGSSMALFGGTAPLVAHALQDLSHVAAAPILSIFMAAILGLIALHQQEQASQKRFLFEKSVHYN